MPREGTMYIYWVVPWEQGFQNPQCLYSKTNTQKHHSIHQDSLGEDHYLNKTEISQHIVQPTTEWNTFSFETVFFFTVPD